MFRVMLVLVFVFGGSLLAAPPSVESIQPSAGQRGSEFTLKISGSRLTEPQELLWDSPGLACTKLLATSDTELLATFRATAEAALGEHAFRLRTPGGVSELKTFHVSPFPVVSETEPNDQPESAQTVSPNRTVSGVMNSTDVDHFAVTLQPGERLSAEVVGVRLGAEFADIALRVFGPDGQLLTQVDDTPLFRQDPVVSFRAPRGGRYVVQLRDTTLGGSPSHRYLLHLGHFPRPVSIFPVGGQAGTTVNVTTNDGSTVTLNLPKTDAKFRWFPTENGISAPTPQPFRVSAFPNVTEGQASPAVAWPVAFNGVITHPGEADSFRFRAKQGDTINVEAFAYRLGSPIDTVVAVLDANGELLAANDDDETHDSRVTIRIPADGEYVLRVSDKRNQGGPNFVYRVELDKPAVGLNVFLPERVRKSQERAVVTVPRGNRVTAFLAVQRDGFADPVTLTHGDLPPGVSVKLGTIPVNEYLLPVVFEAAADAPLGGKLVPITGTAGTLRGGFVQEIGLVRGPGDSQVHQVTLDKLAVVVVPASPVAVQIVPPTQPLVPDSTLAVRVKIARQEGFAEAVDLTFPTLPPGVEVPTSVTIPPDQTEAVVTLVASPEADLGDWSLVAEVAAAKRGRGDRDPLLVGNNGLGTGAGAMPTPPGGGGPGGRRRRTGSVQELVPVASQAVAIRTQKPRLQGQIAPIAVEQGQTVSVVCQLDAVLTASSPFVAKLDGLPPRATAADVAVNGKTIRFTVKVDPTTPLGQVKSLVCELHGTVDNQPVVYRVARNSVFRVAAPGTLQSDASGKTLSPLEALRQHEKK